ncbi:MAG: aldo/keto reductase [Bacillota bacterium]|nr:aldo/keto reductase [Bacillota bacterium]
MEKTRLGRTNLLVSRTAFGALPIQRVSFDEAKKLLVKAYDNGINFFDTARAYSDSEEKLGYALSDVRKDIILATKTFAKDKQSLFSNLETSLSNLKTDYIDIYQLHNPEELPDPHDPEGVYKGLMEAKEKGLIRFVGITCHRLDNALEAVCSGLYDTVQFPLSYISSEKELSIIDECIKHDIGLIAMKALSGGLITNAACAFAFLRMYKNVTPIWGIQRESELDEFLALEKNPPQMSEEMWDYIKKDRNQLSGNFCRGCGYCMPCPAQINIPIAARMSLLLRRAPYQQFITEKGKEGMELINKCVDCGQCKTKCPYKLDTPRILKDMLKDYLEFYRSHTQK